MAARLRRHGLAATVFPVAGGEQAKQWSVAGRLLEHCSDAGLERDDCIVAVGGGSVGDVAGLVAATYMRGIAWVVVPTTLLAMVDSAVGGKTAVNLRRGKNLAGVFWQPRAVVCDSDMLDTLGERSFRSAFAEIVKSSMVGGGELAEVVDRRLPAALQRDRDALDRADPRLLRAQGGRRRRRRARVRQACHPQLRTHGGTCGGGSDRPRRRPRPRRGGGLRHARRRRAQRRRGGLSRRRTSPTRTSSSTPAG